MAENTLRRKVLTGMFWRFGERICAQLVTFVVSIVLARILDPSHYGIISMITIFITIANVFVTDSFGKALVQKKDANSADFSSVFYFNILFSWIVYAVVYVIAPYIASFYNEPLLTPTMRVLALQLPLAGVNSVQQVGSLGVGWAILNEFCYGYSRIMVYCAVASNTRMELEEADGVAFIWLEDAFNKSR